MFDSQATFKQIVDKIMYDNSYGIKGVQFSCKLLSDIYQGFRREQQAELLALSETFSMTELGYKVLEYNDKSKVFYYR